MHHIFSRLTDSQQDAVRAVVFIAGYLVTAILPARLDRRIIDSLSSLLLRVQPQRIKVRAAGIAGILGIDPDGPEATEIASHHYRLMIEHAWGRFRGLHRRGWRPEIRVEGIEEIRRAVDRGRGVILWRWSFCNTPIVKIAMWREGIPLVHLSSRIHGAWSGGWVGRHVLNPIYRRTEDCYLKQRVVIPQSGSHAYMKTLLDCLADNCVVSIVGDHRGSQNITASFFDGTSEFATGAPALAWKTGATLLTAYAISESCCSYRVVIEGPVDVDRNLPRREFASHAIAEFARRLEAAVVKHPASWGSWRAFLEREEPFRRPGSDAENAAPTSSPEVSRSEAG